MTRDAWRAALVSMLMFVACEPDKPLEVAAEPSLRQVSGVALQAHLSSRELR
jgi:hypothetical protein